METCLSTLTDTLPRYLATFLTTLLSLKYEFLPVRKQEPSPLSTVHSATGIRSFRNGSQTQERRAKTASYLTLEGHILTQNRGLPAELQQDTRPRDLRRPWLPVRCKSPVGSGVPPCLPVALLLPSPSSCKVS